MTLQRADSRRPSREALQVLMLDLWATVPYYTAYLSRALLHLGVPVQIASITYYLDHECFRSRGLQIDPGISDRVGRLRLPRSIRRLFKLVEGAVNLGALSLRVLLRPPAVVHVQFLPLLRSRLPMDLWFVRLCRRRGSRLVLTVHDLLPHDTGEEHCAIYNRLYAEMDALVCHSGHIRARLLDEFGVPPAKIAVIPHGPFFYDLPAVEPESGGAAQNVVGEQTVLWQGIVFPYKGVDLLLSAWQRVEARNERMRLVVLGTGDPGLLSDLQRQAQDLDLKRVHFEARFCTPEELVAAYRAASAVVYPYRAITTSGALATGLALGKVIVASDLPVFREALVEDETAVFADPHDAGALAEALLRAVQDNELRHRLETNVAALRFGDQSWAAIAEATAEVYRRALEWSR